MCQQTQGFSANTDVVTKFDLVSTVWLACFDHMSLLAQECYSLADCITHILGHTNHCFPDTVLLQVKGAAGDVADKSGAGDVADSVGGALQDVKPKRGLFERINDEALTKNSPSVQQGQKSS